jgi:hypothetical protein
VAEVLPLLAALALPVLAGLFAWWRSRAARAAGMRAVATKLSELQQRLATGAQRADADPFLVEFGRRTGRAARWTAAAEVAFSPALLIAIAAAVGHSSMLIVSIGLAAYAAAQGFRRSDGPHSSGRPLAKPAVLVVFVVFSGLTQVLTVVLAVSGSGWWTTLAAGVACVSLFDSAMLAHRSGVTVLKSLAYQLVDRGEPADPRDAVAASGWLVHVLRPRLRSAATACLTLFAVLLTMLVGDAPLWAAVVVGCTLVEPLVVLGRAWRISLLSTPAARSR